MQARCTGMQRGCWRDAGLRRDSGQGHGLLGCGQDVLCSHSALGCGRDAGCKHTVAGCRRDAGGMQGSGEMQNAGTLCWDAGCVRDTGCRHAVPGCRRDLCQDMSMLHKAMLRLCPGQPGNKPRDLSVPTRGKKQLVILWHKDGDREGRGAWEQAPPWNSCTPEGCMKS